MSTADDKAYIMYEAPRQELDLKDKTLSFTREPRGDLEKRNGGGEQKGRDAASTVGRRRANRRGKTKQHRTVQQGCTVETLKKLKASVAGINEKRNLSGKNTE